MKYHFYKAQQLDFRTKIILDMSCLFPHKFEIFMGEIIPASFSYNVQQKT